MVKGISCLPVLILPSAMQHSNEDMYVAEVEAPEKLGSVELTCRSLVASAADARTNMIVVIEANSRVTCSRTDSAPKGRKSRALDLPV